MANNKLSIGGLPINSENVKIFQYFIIGLVLFVIITIQLRKTRQDKAYKDALTNPDAGLAVRVRQACNPSGVTLMIDFDFTWTDDLMLIADEINDISAVGEAYYNLYRENMLQRLEKELNSTDFGEWSRRATASKTAQIETGTLQGKTVVAVIDTPVFLDTDSTKVAKISKAGQIIGKAIRAYKITSGGVSKRYWLVSWSSYGFLYNQGLVLESNIKSQ